MEAKEKEYPKLISFGLLFETPKGSKRVIIDVGENGYFNSDYVKENEKGEMLITPGGTHKDSDITKILGNLALNEIVEAVDRAYQKDFGVGAPQEVKEIYENFSKSAPRRIS